MKNLPILLSVKRGQFRCDDSSAEESDKHFKSMRPKILKRDDFSCQFCGFRSQKYQEVHHIDDNHDNNNENNLITTCSLCHACFHVGFSGLNNRGTIIYLNPKLGITQAELNQLVRTLWIGELSTDQSIKMLSLNMLARLYKQTVPADRKIGSSDAIVLADFLLQLTDDVYDKRKENLNGFYMLPLKDGFLPQLKYWSESNFKNIPSDKWLDITIQKTSKWATNKFGDSSNESILEVMTKE